ncbi:MAG: response regulator [Lachnospiraceae bacterium]
MGYLNVLLVDDENLVVEDLQTLIDWNSCGFQIAGFAYNGIQTNRLIQKIQPDVVFMDVSLPDTDGISLSRHLRNRYPDVIIIILSGYMDFSYAQGAVEIGALSYLVKHQMTADHLIEVLALARETIEKKRLSKLLGSRLLLRDILEHNTPMLAEASDALSAYRDSFLLLLLTPITPYFHKPGQEPLIYQPHISELLDLREPGIRILDIFIHHSDFLIFLAPEADTRAGSRYRGNLEPLIKKLQEHLKKQTGQSFFTLYADSETKLSGLNGDYGFLSSSRERYRFHPEKESLCLNMTKISPHITPDFSFINRETFIHSHQKFIGKLVQCLTQLQSDKNLPGFMQCCELTVLLLSGLSEYHASINLNSSGEECSYTGQIASILITECQKYYRVYEQQKNYSPSTNYILQYIHDHYNHTPSLAEAAARLKSNPMYMGQKFKKDTGRTFHDYLNEYRIEKAKELLACGSLKIFEVSEQVGISNSQYFSKVFKDLTNVTPNEYRLGHFSFRR